MDGREHLAAGTGALDRGDWSAARQAFEASWALQETAEALDGLGRAHWWLNDPGAALDARARAFALFRRDQRDAEAAAVAIWLSRQYRDLFRRDVMADGWLARARSIVADLADGGSLPGWLLVTTADAADVPSSPSETEEAVTIAREHADVDLEITALARRGALEVSAGRIHAGLSDLNEAMVAATSGEGRDVQYVGEALCTLLEVAGWLGDPGIVEPWAQQLVDFQTSYAFGPLMPFDSGSATDLISSFCAGCCGGVYLVTGRLDAAEEQLVLAVSRLVTTGLRPRCLHPVAQLVELRVLQGRLEEAEALLVGFEAEWECVTAGAALDLACGRATRAVAALEDALVVLAGAPLRALPVHALLVDAALAVDDVAAAAASAEAISALADQTGTTLHQAQADHARGKVALASADPAAPALLRSAALRYAESAAPLPACRARLALAAALVESDRGLAVTEARSALQALDRMGATAEADRAAAFLRGLGVKGRTGPRDVGGLSRREREVLALVAEGLANAEIAERLFISTKTAGNHVSNILTKLGLRSRTEAAAFALLNMARPAPPGRRRPG